MPVVLGRGVQGIAAEATEGDVIKFEGNDVDFTVMPPHKQPLKNESKSIWVQYPDGEPGYGWVTQKITWLLRDWPEPDCVVES